MARFFHSFMLFYMSCTFFDRRFPLKKEIQKLSNLHSCAYVYTSVYSCATLDSVKNPCHELFPQ